MNSEDKRAVTWVRESEKMEKPFTGKYWDSEDEGTYHCDKCDSELFSSEDKFDSGTGWPSFFADDEEKEESVKVENGEVSCALCDNHLGTVETFGKNKYYRLNSPALNFLKPLPEKEEEEAEEKKEDGSKVKEKGNRTKSLLKDIGKLAIGGAVGAGAVGAAIFFSSPSFMCEAPALNNPSAMQSETKQEAPTTSNPSIKTSPPASVLPNRINPASTAPPSAATTTGELPSQDLMAVTEPPASPIEPLPQTQTNPYPPGRSARPDFPAPVPSEPPKEESGIAESGSKTP